MATSKPQLDGVQFESVRKVVDPDYLDLVASLEEAYYGKRDENGRFIKGTGWRDGVSSPWHGFDVLPTPEENKAQFDRLHGNIWRQYQIDIAAENEKQGRPYDRDKVDPVADEKSGKRRSEVETEKLAALGSAEREAAQSVSRARNK